MRNHNFLPGAFAIVLLFGCGNPGSSLISPNDSQKQTQSDRQSIQTIFSELSTISNSSDSLSNKVVKLRSINTGNTPQDFRVAILSLIHSFESYVSLEKEAESFKAEMESGGAMLESFIRGYNGDPFGKTLEMQAKAEQIQQRAKNLELQIQSNLQRLEQVAASYGVQ